MFARGGNLAAVDLYLQALSKDLHPIGEPRQITFQRWMDLAGITWPPDGREIVYSGLTSTSSEMWRIPASGGTPRKLAFGKDQVRSVAISPRGNRLVFQQVTTDLNIWRLQLRGAVGKAGDPVNLISSTWSDLAPQYSPDGNRIVFVSARSGHDELWVCHSDGTEPVQLTSIQGLAGSPHWSPDGKQIVFDSTARGNFDVYVIGVEGGRPLPLTNHPADDAIASFSKDGRWIYFASSRTGRFEIWKMPAEGGEPVQLTRKGGWIGRESPDGKSLYYAPSRDLSSLWRVPLAGGEEQKIIDSVVGTSFEVTAKGIYFARPRLRGAGNPIEFFDFATEKISTVSSTLNPIVWSLGVSPDGRYLLYSQNDRAGSDLILVENFR